MAVNTINVDIPYNVYKAFMPVAGKIPVMALHAHIAWAMALYREMEGRLPAVRYTVNGNAVDDVYGYMYTLWIAQHGLQSAIGIT